MAEKILNDIQNTKLIYQTGTSDLDGFSEYQIKDELNQYIEERKKNGINEEELQELLLKIEKLFENQNDDKRDLKEKFEKLKEEEKKETREKIDKEACVQEAKKTMYEKLGINDNKEKNSTINNFLKGIIDVIILENYDLVIEIINTNGKILLDVIKQLASWEGIKMLASAVKESVWKLFSGDAYEKGKSIAELGLITTGAGTGVFIGKQGLKTGIKQIAKLKLNKEHLVSSAEVKNVIHDTSKKINEIIPKQQIDFEKLLIRDIAKLGDVDRIEAARFFLKGKELSGIQKKAILEAHEVGKGVADIGIPELREKTKILKEAGFSQEERRILFKKSICGDHLPEGGIQKKLDDLYKLANKTKGEYNDLLQKIGNPNGFSDIVEIKKASLKNNDAALSKILKEYKGNPEKIKDILRGSIVFHDMDDLIIGIDRLKQSGNKLDVKVRLDKIKQNDILINITHPPDGFVSELQFHILETFNIKEKGYKLTEDVIKLPPWSSSERAIVNNLKEGKGGRILKKDIHLPEYGKKVSGHQLYEIIRALGKTKAEKELFKKLNEIEEVLNVYAREKYKIRTGKDFLTPEQLKVVLEKFNK